MSNLDLNSTELEKLKVLFRSKSQLVRFLGYQMDLNAKKLYDKLRREELNEGTAKILSILLAHYAKAKPLDPPEKLTKFADLPGGHAYEQAFNQRVIQPTAKMFGNNKDGLINAAELLDGKALGYGDASVEIQALPKIPLTYILWEANEFPASANVLFDASASSYLPTEDLAVLAELTTIRLEAAHAVLENQI